MKTLQEFKKTKDYLICVDSDGCAMDTMNIKHVRCFGPLMVEEWGLEQWKDKILDWWNTVNLYSMDRGINRFLGLSKVLEEVNKDVKPIEGIAQFSSWAHATKELSNTSVLAAAEESGLEIFKKAYAWSVAVNAAILALPDNLKTPFPEVRECLAMAHKKANLCIISSANPEAISEEWNKYHLAEYTDVSLSQDVGSKAYCISKMLEHGFDKNQVLMIGDAPGDLEAAKKNGILFYPILVRHEKEAWNQFKVEGMERFYSHTYCGTYQQTLVSEFLGNLSS